jgi:hypothetical protein
MLSISGKLARLSFRTLDKLARVCGAILVLACAALSHVKLLLQKMDGLLREGTVTNDSAIIINLQVHESSTVVRLTYLCQAANIRLNLCSIQPPANFEEGDAALSYLRYSGNSAT